MSEFMLTLCGTFKKRVAIVFPDCYVDVYHAETSGQDSIFVVFANVSTVDKAPKGVLLHANGYMLFSLYGDGDPVNPWYIDRPVMYYYDRDIVKQFQRIGAKTRQDALEQLLAWMTRHRRVMLASRPRAITTRNFGEDMPT